jgi:hypothetical protein
MRKAVEQYLPKSKSVVWPLIPANDNDPPEPPPLQVSAF